MLVIFLIIKFLMVLFFGIFEFDSFVIFLVEDLNLIIKFERFVFILILLILIFCKLMNVILLFFGFLVGLVVINVVLLLFVI